MIAENFNRTAGRPRVLVAPLDWGLGHATRCIPVVHQLIDGGLEVVVAAGPSASALLKEEFPGLEFLPLKDHNVRYSRNPRLLLLTLLLQASRLLFHIYKEHRWLKRAVEQHRLDAVVSDNRPGLYHPSIPCIYMTHQLFIKTGNGFTERLAQKIHYWFINRYRECWVPDFQGADNLAGDLSHPRKMPAVPVNYIGPLSRFNNTNAEIKYRVAFILSGPEPQRTVFENLVLDELRHYKERVLVVRGLPGKSFPAPVADANIEIQDHLSATALNEAIGRSGIIIARSGYTTIMDLVKLKRNAVLVPTPGQTEQEYLGTYLMEKKMFLSVKQTGFSLAGVLNKMADFPFTPVEFSLEGYKVAVENFIAQLMKR